MDKVPEFQAHPQFTRSPQPEFVKPNVFDRYEGTKMPFNSHNSRVRRRQ